MQPTDSTASTDDPPAPTAPIPHVADPAQSFEHDTRSPVCAIL